MEFDSSDFVWQYVDFLSLKTKASKLFAHNNNFTLFLANISNIYKS